MPQIADRGQPIRHPYVKKGAFPGPRNFREEDSLAHPRRDKWQMQRSMAERDDRHERELQQRQRRFFSIDNCIPDVETERASACKSIVLP